MSAVPVLAESSHYPLLNVFWTILMLFLWILWFFLLFRIIGDIFRSRDLSGWGKAGWTIFLIIVPFFAALVYLIVRGSSLHERDAQQAAAANEAMRSYIRESAGSSSGSADELDKLAALRDRGILTQAEFDAQKAKILVS